MLNCECWQASRQPDFALGITVIYGADIVVELQGGYFSQTTES